MDFNEILVDIILNEKHDGDKGIDWLYGEYVKRGYNKSKEMFCEEFVKNIGGQGTNDLTESEATQVAGGNGKFIKRGASVGLATALLSGPLMPTHVSGETESSTVVSKNISERQQVKSKQGFAELIEGFISTAFKVFNDEDLKRIFMPISKAGGLALLGASTIYLIIRIVKKISEAKTPEEVLQSTAKGINKILDGQDGKESKKKGVVAVLTSCLSALLKFAKKEQKPQLEELYRQQFVPEGEPKVFDKWNDLKAAFTNVLGEIKKELSEKPKGKLLPDLFEQRKNELMVDIFEKRVDDLIKVFEGKTDPKKEDPKKEEPKKEEPKKEKPKKEKPKKEEKKEEENENSVLLPDCTSIFDSTYDINDPHGSYTTKALEDNENVSKETGINRNVLDAVDNFVKTQTKRIRYTNLGQDSILVVCKKMTIDADFEDQINGISEKNARKNLYLVLDNCEVLYTCLPESTEIKVLDLRGTTKFTENLKCPVSVNKVLLRNNTESKANQLWLLDCKKLGPIYQLSTDKRPFNSDRMYLNSCHLGGNFRLVNLNECCKELLTQTCINRSYCPNGSLEPIKKCFEENSKPPGTDLKGE